MAEVRDRAMQIRQDTHTLTNQLKDIRGAVQEAGRINKRGRIVAQIPGISTQRLILNLVRTLSGCDTCTVLAAQRLLHGSFFTAKRSMAERRRHLRRHLETSWVCEMENIPMSSRGARLRHVRLAFKLVAEVRLMRRLAEHHARGVSPDGVRLVEVLLE